MDHVDIGQAHLAGLPLDIHRLRPVERTVDQRLLQRQVGAVFVQVQVQVQGSVQLPLPAAVRAGDHPQAAVGSRWQPLAWVLGSSANHTVQVASGRIGQ